MVCAGTSPLLYRPLKHAQKNDPAFCDNYINCYLANDGLVAPKYGDPERDELAYRTFSRAYPNLEVILVWVYTLNGGGGSIHCSTQQEPLPV